MRKVIATFGTGPLAAASEISLPLMARYAMRHGYSLVSLGPESVDSLVGELGLPPSWAKVWMVRQLLESGYRAVVWLDADVVVVRGDRDIIDDVRHWSPLSMVVQETQDGRVPSCGVMVATKESKSVFDRVMNRAVNHYIKHVDLPRADCWWEQSAVIEALGGSAHPTPIVTPPPSDLWGELPYEWNPHPLDVRGIPDDCRFFHATATGDRIGEMKKWAAKTQW